MRLPLRYNLRSMTQRKVRTTLTALGVGVAIFVSILMLALSRGLLTSTLNSASPTNVIVLSKGAEAMEFSAIDLSVLHLLESSAQIRVEAGRPLASPEQYISTFVRLPDQAAMGERRGVVRGVLPVALSVHDQVHIVEGTEPQRGFKVTVGKLAATKMGVPSDALAVGKMIEYEGQQWTIAGVLEAPGTTFDSEIWAHLDDLRVVTKRADYSAIVLEAQDPQATDDLLFDLATRTDIRVDAKTEAAYYAALANAMKPVQAVSLLMTVILIVGASLAGMNTMLTSILGRTREMGMLLVLGYKRKAILVSFMIESILICLAGGALGVLGGAFLNGLPMRMPMGAFRFAVDPITLGTGLGLAAVIGTVGAIVPVWRVARLPTVEALRSE